MTGIAFGFTGDFPPQAAYVVVKPMSVNGQALKPGDALPEDAGIRQNPRRIQQLCRNRYLRLAVVPVVAASKPSAKVEVGAAPKTTAKTVQPKTRNRR